jgi:hypothetical protein
LNGINQTVTSDTGGVITFTVNGGSSLYGASLPLVISNTNGTSNIQNLTLLPQVGWSYVVVSTPNTTTSLRLQSAPDIAAADQITWNNSSVVVYPDGTFSCAKTVTNFLVQVGTATYGWGSEATETIN